MATPADLLTLGIARGIELIGGPAHGGQIRSVAAVEHLGEVQRTDPGALLVLMPAAHAGAAAYEVDVALRRSTERGHPALLIVGRDRLSVTARRIADRAALPVLSAPADTNVAELILWIDRIARGGDADQLARAEAGLAALTATPDDAGTQQLCAAISTALGSQIHLVSVGAGGEPVFVGDRAVAEVRSSVDEPAARLLLPALASRLARVKQRELEHAFAPTQTRGELLSQIIVADPANLTRLTEQARRIGFPVDNTHVAVWLNLNPQTEDGNEPSLAEQRRLVDTTEHICLTRLHDGNATWQFARFDGGLLALCSDDHDGDQLAQHVAAEMAKVIDLLESHGHASVYAGQGTYQAGFEGIRHSTFEARAAAELAEQNAHPGKLAAFDQTGIGRVLADLYASPLSRRVVADTLAPLRSLGPVREAQAIETLTAYLDAQSSPKHAATRLHLHPNAVSYRITRITEHLDIDLTDPDTRFAIHLACRIRQTATA